MKFAKVIIVSVLALILFTGCAEMQQGSSSTSASPVLDRIQKRGELIVGTMGNMPPLNMTSKDGEIFGLEPDLAKLMAAAMNVKVNSLPSHFPSCCRPCKPGKLTWFCPV